MADHRYTLFTNYMHNELGITKDDIRLWTKEAVYEVATKYVEEQFSERSLDERIAKLLGSSYWGKDRLHPDIIQVVAKELLNRLDISISDKSNEQQD